MSYKPWEDMEETWSISQSEGSRSEEAAHCVTPAVRHSGDSEKIGGGQGLGSAGQSPHLRPTTPVTSAEIPLAL